MAGDRRKTEEDNDKRRAVWCEVPAETRRRLRVLAAREDTKMGALMREALEEYLDSRGA